MSEIEGYTSFNKPNREKCKYCHKIIRWTVDEYATDTHYPKKGLGISEYYHVECEKNEKK